MGELSAEPKCLVDGSQNSALHCTASGMVGDLPVWAGLLYLSR